MEEKLPKNLEKLISQLDHAVPPVTPTNQTGLSTNNGVKADTDPNRDMAEMVNAARRLAHGPKPTLSAAALDRIEARLRARHAALHHEADHSTQPDRVIEQTALHRAGPQRPISMGTPISRPTASRAKPRPEAPSRARRMVRASWQGTKRTLRYVAAVLLVMVLLTSGLTAASANSVPNDPLYTVKLGVEEIRLALVSNADEPGLRVNFAGRRLDEFDTLLDRKIIYPKVLEEASAQMNRALTLLAAGYGNRQKLDAQIADLTYQQGQLLAEAAQIAPPDTYARLQVVSTWNSALYVRVVAEGAANTSGSVLTSGQGAPPILPEVQTTSVPGDIPESELDITLSPEIPGDGSAATLSGAEDDGDPKAAKDKDNNGQGQGTTGNQGQGPGSNNGQGQGTTGNQGQGQGNIDNPGQVQGTTGNQGQGQDKDKDKDKK